VPRVSDEHLAARRRQILDAAVTCFARQGLHRTTMQDIFREAELSPGAVYRYFPSKEAILRAIASEAFGNVSRVMRDEAPPSFAEAALEPYRLLAELPIGTPEERTRLIVQLFGEALRDPTVHELVMGVVDFARGQFAERVRADQADGRLPADVDPDALARTVVALFHGYLIQRALYGEVDLPSYERAVGALLAGLEVRPPGSAPRPGSARGS
jgi:AcrR family transcriptional regulator